MGEQNNQYVGAMQTAMDRLRPEEFVSAGVLFRDVLRNKGCVYCMGNGGSSSTASHLASDLGKNVRHPSGPRLRTASLTDNVSWLTAVSNDVCYEDCFAEQLRDTLEPTDLLIAISASGDSENLVRAFNLARQIGTPRLAMIGFDGGRLARLATTRVWVDSHDYGIVESIHVFVVHLLVNQLVAAMDSPTEPGLNSRIETTRTRSIDGLPLAPHPAGLRSVLGNVDH